MKRVIIFFQDTWIISLAKPVEIFFMVSISEIPTKEYWKNSGKVMDTEKERIPKQFSLVDTWFTPLANI